MLCTTLLWREVPLAAKTWRVRKPSVLLMLSPFRHKAESGVAWYSGCPTVCSMCALVLARANDARQFDTTFHYETLTPTQYSVERYIFTVVGLLGSLGGRVKRPP